MRNKRAILLGHLPLLVCGLSLLLIPRPASAQVWVDANQLDGKLPDWVDPAYAEPTHTDRGSGSHVVRVWVAPVYRTVSRRCWCDPVYRTVCRGVWHESEVQVVRVRVWVPARYEWRENRCGEVERLCVEEAHYETTRREVAVKPGRWEDVFVEEVLTPGHFEDRVERELVAAGHWE